MNTQILNELYNSNKLLVTKEDLLDKGFNFSEFFSTKHTEHFFDNGENNFNYTDFICGSFYVKIIWVNNQVNGIYVRLYFQLIKFAWEDELLNNMKLAHSLLNNRKINAGSWCGYTYESEIADKQLAEHFREKYYSNENQIEDSVCLLKMRVNSLNNTKLYLEEIIKQLEEIKSIEDRAFE